MKGWVETETPEGLLHTRPGTPDRWDVAVRRSLVLGPSDAGPGAPLSRRRIARQVRQDLWRVAAPVRGFVPRILVALRDNHLYITAGGVVLTGRAPTGLALRVAEVLDKTDHHRRWLGYASDRGGKGPRHVQEDPDRQ